MILYIGDLVEIKYKLDEDVIEYICKGKIKEVKELFIKLDISKKYKIFERMIYFWELKEIKKVDDEDEKDN